MKQCTPLSHVDTLLQENTNKKKARGTFTVLVLLLFYCCRSSHHVKILKSSIENQESQVTESLSCKCGRRRSRPRDLADPVASCARFPVPRRRYAVEYLHRCQLCISAFLWTTLLTAVTSKLSKWHCNPRRCKSLPHQHNIPQFVRSF